MIVDVTFDFRSDSGGANRDPDTYSPTLRRYHHLLWSKPLPSGEPFNLTTDTSGPYLHRRGTPGIGEFFLSSDTMTQTFTHWLALRHITDQLSRGEIDHFKHMAYTIGDMIVFPGNKIDGKPTINVARGFNRSISDRFDLTLECIRRHYLHEWNPLEATLDRYVDFFQLFVDFDGYVEFFHLQDLVGADGLRYFMPFDNFQSVAFPRDVEAFRAYRELAIDFITARNNRIARLGL